MTLVPGPRDSDGLPESIRAWKRRIEERDPTRTFAVGLLYGPSGSGKSSLVRAGLLPRLSRPRAGDLRGGLFSRDRGRLRAALSREFPDLAACSGLDQAAAAIRDRAAAQRGSKVLIVLDQFEQWLQSHPDDLDGELVAALRQCDGLGLQALSWFATTSGWPSPGFCEALEVRLIEGVNSAPVELFDLDHARTVLAELGRALGRLPEAAHCRGTERGRFLDKAVKELASPDGRVIPVRLTLFAEMLRHRDWSTATLRELGGMDGIGVMFLEENFSARTAPPAHRFHERAARAVLHALLPDAGSDLKGRWRPVRAAPEGLGLRRTPRRIRRADLHPRQRAAHGHSR